MSYEFPKTDTGYDFNKLKSVAMAADQGTSFPASPVTGQWFYRTDVTALFIYEGVWKPIISFGAVTLYVDKTNGSDAVGQGYSSGAGATATIQYAVDLLPAINGGNVVINCTAESYAEKVTIQDKKFSGNYTFTILGTLPTATETGTASSGTNYVMGAAGSGATQPTLVDSSKTWTVNAYANMLLVITGGTGAGQERWIYTNTATALTLDGVWATTPNATSTYAIYNPANMTSFTGTSQGINCLSQTGLILKYLYFSSNAEGLITPPLLINNRSTISLYSVMFNANTAGNDLIRLFGNSQIGEIDRLLIYGTFLTAIRVENSSFPVSAATITNTRIEKTGGVSGIGIFLAAQSFMSNNDNNSYAGNGLVIRGCNVGMQINSASRSDITKTIIKSGGKGLKIFGGCFFILRGNNDISNNTSDGITLDGASYLNFSNVTTTQINNNGGYGVRIKGYSFAAAAVSTISYTTNTLGTYIRIEQQGDTLPVQIFNQTSTGDILELQDNGTVTFEARDGGNVAMPQDSKKFLLGAGDDASIQYDGTDMIIKPDEVGTGSVKFDGKARLKGYTVATLPAGVQGDIAYCTDLTAPTYMATAVGGGAVVGKVFYDGSSWIT